KLLLLALFLGACLSFGDGKLYPRNIKKRTPKGRRRWGGPETNSGQNFGGWLLRITDSNGHFACGGAYYAPMLVITSANCMYPYRNSLQGASVEGTAYTKCDHELYSEIDTIIFPDKFKYGKRYMDVAVVRIKSPIRGRLTEFIKLCSVNLQPLMKTTVFGWGHDSMEVQKPSLHPRNASLSVMGTRVCRLTFGTKLLLSSTSMCVKQPANPKDCLYDGGCPMIYKNELCGVVSVGSQCQNTSFPGIYTNIKKVAKFIIDTEQAI
ncbi:hypothetical protein KR018_006513, partial [Drosophila ironensis]